MDTQENNLGKVKKTDYQGQNLGAVDAEKSSNFDDAYEASGDAVRANPSKDSDKDVELEKGPSFDREAQAKDSDQSLSQQEQQQSAGIPTQSSSTRKSHEGAGRSSSDTYSENTDRSDLDEEGIDVKGDDEVSEETIEESQLNRNNRGSAPHVSHG